MQCLAMEISDLIRSQRKAQKLSQRALAQRLGVSFGLVGQWETGETKPTMERIVDLCAVFGISAQTFLEPGAPYHGQMVENGDEFEVLTLWRKIKKAEDRAFVLRFLRNAASASAA